MHIGAKAAPALGLLGAPGARRAAWALASIAFAAKYTLELKAPGGSLQPPGAKADDEGPSWESGAFIPGRTGRWPGARASAPPLPAAAPRASARHVHDRGRHDAAEQRGEEHVDRRLARATAAEHLCAVLARAPPHHEDEDAD